MLYFCWRVWGCCAKRLSKPKSKCNRCLILILSTGGASREVMPYSHIFLSSVGDNQSKFCTAHAGFLGFLHQSNKCTEQLETCNSQKNRNDTNMKSKIKLSNLPSPPSNLAGQRRFKNLVEPNFVSVLHILVYKFIPHIMKESCVFYHYLQLSWYKQQAICTEWNSGANCTQTQTPFLFICNFQHVIQFIY